MDSLTTFFELEGHFKVKIKQRCNLCGKFHTTPVNGARLGDKLFWKNLLQAAQSKEEIFINFI
jgi:hypothetical protein